MGVCCRYGTVWEREMGAPAHEWQPVLGTVKKRDLVAGTLAAARDLLAVAAWSQCWGSPVAPPHCYQCHLWATPGPQGNGGGGEEPQGSPSTGLSSSEHTYCQVPLFLSTQHWLPLLIMDRWPNNCPHLI